MPRDAVTGIADSEAPGVRRFDDEVFLAVHHGRGIRQIEQLHARVRVLGGDRLVPEIEAQPVRPGAAHDACQDERRRPERQVWKL